MKLRGSRRVLFSLLPLVVIFVSAELGLRAAHWPPVPGHFDHNAPFWIVDPDLSDKEFDHPEEATQFPVSTDSHGLRAPKHDGPKAPGELRIMTMGCSTTFGWGVLDAESYPARLEALAHAAGDPEVAVINAGQPGYTSFQGRWLWDTVLKSYAPDVVILGFVVQDARKSAYTDQSQAVLMADDRFLKDHLLWKSKVYLALRALIGDVQIRAKERPEGDAPDDVHGVYRVPVDEYMDNLRALIKDARALGATPVLFGYPLEREGYTAEHRAALRALSTETATPLLDLQPAMTEASAQATLYFERDRGHANAAGNDWIAHAVLAFLQSHALIPQR